MATPKSEMTYISIDDFKTDYEKQLFEDTFDKVYNGYYDHKNPVPFDLDNIPDNGSICLPDLFSQEKVDLVYTSIALQNDIQTLSSIADKFFKIRTFDYDGRKYKQSESRILLEKLKPEQEDINNRLKNNDVLIYQFFKTKHKDSRIESLYRDFFSYDKVYDEKYNIYAQLVNDIQFVYETTPYDTIRQKLKKVKAIEIEFKKSLDEIINDERYQTALTQEMKEQLASYISSDLSYFESQIYNKKELDTLFTAMNEFLRLIGREYLLTKKKLLNYQVELLSSREHQ